MQGAEKEGVGRGIGGHTGSFWMHQRRRDDRCSREGGQAGWQGEGLSILLRSMGLKLRTIGSLRKAVSRV